MAEKDELSHNAKVALAGFTSYYDHSGQYDYAKMDPERGGLHEEDFARMVGVDPTSAMDTMKELAEAGYVRMQDVPKTVMAPSVWPTQKGIDLGKKVIDELRQEEKDKAASEKQKMVVSRNNPVAPSREAHPPGAGEPPPSTPSTPAPASASAPTAPPSSSGSSSKK